MKNERKVAQPTYVTHMKAFSLQQGEMIEYGEAAFQCFIVVTAGHVQCAYVEMMPLHKGDCVVVKCDHSFRLIGVDSNACGYIIQFQSELSSFVASRPKVVRIKPFHSVLHQLHYIYAQFDDASLTVQFENQHMFLTIIETMMKALHTYDEVGDAQAMVRASIDYIHQHYMHRLTVEQLAMQANISVRQYVRIFKKLTATTPIMYINQYRIYRAQELLLQTDDVVQKIALHVGFDDVSYFNRLFKQKVGCSPKAYIRLRQKDAKIITLHYIGELLALNIVPLADLKTALTQVYELPKHVQQVGEMTCDIEKVKALKPDIVILSDAIEREVKEQLEKFVPIIVIPWDVDPTTRLLQIAKVLGKTKEASRYIAAYEEKRQRVKSLYAQHRPKTAAILRLDEGKVWLHASRFFPVFYNVLPFQPTPHMMVTTERNEQLRRVAVHYDELGIIEADRLFIVLGIEQQFPKWLQQLRATKAWQELGVVQRDDVYILRQQGMTNSIYNQHQQLDVALARNNEQRFILGRMSTCSL